MRIIISYLMTCIMISGAMMFPLIAGAQEERKITLDQVHALYKKSSDALLLSDIDARYHVIGTLFDDSAEVTLTVIIALPRKEPLKATMRYNKQQYIDETLHGDKKAQTQYRDVMHIITDLDIDDDGRSARVKGRTTYVVSVTDSTKTPPITIDANATAICDDNLTILSNGAVKIVKSDCEVTMEYLR